MEYAKHNLRMKKVGEDLENGIEYIEVEELGIRKLSYEMKMKNV
jgi:hypothetical protein